MAGKKVNDVTVEHLSRSLVRLRLKTEMGWKEYLIPAALAANISMDLTAGGMPTNNAPPSRSDEQTVLPDTLTLPLVSDPIRTLSMTEYPDGLAVELKMVMDDAGGAFQRVRIPMFAKTAEALIGAIRDRLDRLARENGAAGQA